MTLSNAPSPEFMAAVGQAIEIAKASPDLAMAFAAQVVPIYAQRKPTLQQAIAGGCQACVYLGLWADVWAGYEPSEHGMIWLFEDGITRTAARDGITMEEQTLNTLLHELEHALQRDHILQHMNARPAYAVTGRG